MEEDRIRSIGLSDIRFSIIGDIIEYLTKDYKNILVGETISLYVENCLLPPWETAQILQPGDCIKVVRNPGLKSNENGFCDSNKDTSPEKPAESNAEEFMKPIDELSNSDKRSNSAKKVRDKIEALK